MEILIFLLGALFGTIVTLALTYQYEFKENYKYPEARSGRKHQKP